MPPLGAHYYFRSRPTLRLEDGSDDLHVSNHADGGAGRRLTRFLPAGVEIVTLPLLLGRYSHPLNLGG
jgi:hypothetical protein